MLCVFIGLFIYLLPQPASLSIEAWKLLAIFIGTIFGLILRPLPMGATALVGLCIAIFTNTLDVKTQALTGFSSHVIWLIVMVFFIARAVIKTNFGIRIAYYFLSLVGSKTLYLGYAMSFAEMCLAPFIPSSTARAGGVMFPIIKSISETLGSTPADGTEKKVGSFLIQVGFHANAITSAMFLTASAANLIAQSLAAQQGIEILWSNWFIASCVPAMCSIILMPYLIYKLDPPQETELQNATKIAQAQLKKLGPVSQKEKYMAGIFVVMLLLWAGETVFGINATTVAFLGVSLCLLVNILDLDDIISEKEAWNTLLWLSILFTMSTYLQKFGLISWMAGYLSALTQGFSPMSVLMILAFSYLYIHYFFAGNTTQVTSVYPAFLAVCIMSGAPPLLSALLLGFLSALYACLTHYATAAAPIYFAAGFVPVKTWWKVGFFISLLYVVCWFGIGMLWWKFLGLY
ncbi:MAG: DASS family sodium-coupled anion symporter [Alphaproteobacteria bacterium]|nr:MAG: DASS family sodium-coupled anion symporter [Alphaproteobacteria bacterium]